MTALTERGLHRWHHLTIGVVTGAVFSGVINNDFLGYDDQDYITDNPLTLGGLTVDGVAEALTSFQVVNWSPLTSISHMLDVSLFGLEPGWHHLMSVALHVVAALCLGSFLFELFKSRWTALLGAIFFAIHPLRVESVAWASERKDVLCTLFFVAAMRSHIRPKVAGFPPRGVVTTLFGLLALLAKPMAVTLPIVLALLDVWPLRRLNRSTLFAIVREKAALAACAGLVAMATLVAQQSAVEVHASLSWGHRAGNAVVAIAAYLKSFLWPVDLAVLVPLPEQGHDTGRVGLAVVLVTVVVGAIWRAGRPAQRLGLAFFFITVFPVVGLIQVGQQAYADRYTYIPSIGLLIIAVDAILATLARFPRITPVVLSAVVLLVVRHGRMTIIQVGHWQTQRTLFEHTVRVTDANPIARALLASALLDEDEPEMAIEHAQEAVRLKPTLDHVDLLGRSLLAAGEPGKASALLEPGCRRAQPHVPSCIHLSEALAHSGQYEAALELLTATRTVAPPTVEFDITEARVRLMTAEPLRSVTLMKSVVARLGDRTDSTTLETFAEALIASGHHREARSIIQVAAARAILERRHRTLARLQGMEASLPP